MILKKHELPEEMCAELISRRNRLETDSDSYYALLFEWIRLAQGIETEETVVLCRTPYRRTELITLGGSQYILVDENLADTLSMLSAAFRMPDPTAYFEMAAQKIAAENCLCNGRWVSGSDYIQNVGRNARRFSEALHQASNSTEFRKERIVQELFILLHEISHKTIDLTSDPERSPYQVTILNAGLSVTQRLIDTHCPGIREDAPLPNWLSSLCNMVPPLRDDTTVLNEVACDTNAIDILLSISKISGFSEEEVCIAIIRLSLALETLTMLDAVDRLIAPEIDIGEVGRSLTNDKVCFHIKSRFEALRTTAIKRCLVAYANKPSISTPDLSTWLTSTTNESTRTVGLFEDSFTSIIRNYVIDLSRREKVIRDNLQEGKMDFLELSLRLEVTIDRFWQLVGW